MKVVIVGCGIGGLALALALRKCKIDYEILERAPELTFVGAGIQLSPNATRVLDWLGVLERLSPVLVRPGQHRFMDWQSGEVLLSTPLGGVVEETFGSMYGHAHRADLLSAFLETLGDDPKVRLGVDVASVGQDGQGGWAQFAEGEVVRGDVVVAADGVRSMVREQCFAPETPKHSGCMAWRGLTPADEIEDLGFEQNSYIWMGPKRSVVIYYVAGGQLLNWIGIGPSDGQTRESWTTQGTVAQALAEYADWHPMVRGLIERSAPPFKWALFDRDPLPSWVQGRIVLIGDAAHAMLPYHAQGAAQSIEDAWVLARTLERESHEIDGALAHYEALRQPRTRQVQEASRAAEHLFHLSDASAVEQRNARFARAQTRMGDGFPPGQEWLFAYDAEKAVMGEDESWQKLAWRA